MQPLKLHIDNIGIKTIVIAELMFITSSSKFFYLSQLGTLDDINK